VRKRNNIIIGDLIIDKNYLLELSGKSAEFNAKKYKLNKNNFSLGGAGMVFSAFKKLDINVKFFTISSNKYRDIFNKLQQKNILFGKEFVIEKKRLWQNKKLLFQVNNIKYKEDDIKKFQNSFLKKINTIKNESNILLCDYRYGVFSKMFTKKIITIFKKKKCELYVDQQSTSVDPDIKKFKYSNYLILNLKEYNKIFKIYKIEENSFLKKLTKLQKMLSINYFVIKKGANGCSIFKDGKILNVTVTKRKNKKVNTIGAGDYFLSAFVTNRGKNVKDRLKFSNNYAYLKIIGKNKVKTF